LDYSGLTGTFDEKICRIKHICVMKKKLFTIALVGTMFSLSGCYTTICPTYAVKPAQEKDVKVEQTKAVATETERPS
jgi:hypothetical protein